MRRFARRVGLFWPLSPPYAHVLSQPKKTHQSPLTFLTQIDIKYSITFFAPFAVACISQVDLAILVTETNS